MKVNHPARKNLKVQELISDLESNVKWLKAEVVFWRCFALMSLLLSLILMLR